MNPVTDPEAMVLDRYLVYDEIASGGMATVHLGRALGPGGVARTVAIKRLHARYAKDPEFSAMFLDEARLATRVHSLTTSREGDLPSPQGRPPTLTARRARRAGPAPV